MKHGQHLIYEECYLPKAGERPSDLSFLGRVCLQVPLHVPVISETPPALRTAVGLLPGVDPHVRLKVCFDREALPAVRTNEGLLPGVDPHVRPQVSFDCEALPALLAIERLL